MTRFSYGENPATSRMTDLTKTFFSLEPESVRRLRGRHSRLDTLLVGRLDLLGNDGGWVTRVGTDSEVCGRLAEVRPVLPVAGSRLRLLFSWGPAPTTG
jgi:hypothetical protein